MANVAEYVQDLEKRITDALTAKGIEVAKGELTLEGETITVPVGESTTAEVKEEVAEEKAPEDAEVTE